MELSEEEKKAIEILKDTRQSWCRILSKYIDKQEKEIEKYKNVIRNLNNNWISKEEIREKIKELETLYNCNLDTAMTSYEMFVFVRSYIDKVKNCLNEL